MPRVKSNVARRRRTKRLFKRTKGYRLGKKNVYKHAKEQFDKSMQYAFRDRRARKREFRSLWIMRINAAARKGGLSYSRFMSGLKKANVQINRKILADLAVNHESAFSELVSLAKNRAGREG